MRDPERFNKRARVAAAAATAAVLLLGLTACSITADKQGEGPKKNVDIQTPFGGLKVRTDVDPKDIGLPVYAGARQVPESEDRKSTRLNSSHIQKSRMPSSA